jgi:hypothetical protein
VNPDELRKQAERAIARGADPVKVRQRLDSLLTTAPRPAAPKAEGRDGFRNAMTGAASVARGVTMGVSDHIAAGASAMLPEALGGSGAGYKENLAALREDAKEAPAIATAGELGGAVVGGIAAPFSLTGRAATAMGLSKTGGGIVARATRPLVRAGMEGVAQGAASGLLANDLTDPDALTRGFVRGGVAGGLMGTALQAVGPVAGGLVRGTGAVARSTLGGLERSLNAGGEAAAASRGGAAMQDELADLAGRAAGVSGGSMPPRNPLNALRGEVREPRGRALEIMAQDFRVGGVDPADALRRLEAGEIADDLNVTPLELGLGPVRRTADVSTIASKEGDAVLLPRLGDRQSRVGDMASRALERASGQPREEGFAVLRQMVDARAAKADPAYKAAYAYGPIRNPETIKAVNDLLARPRYRKAYEMARELAAEDGVVLPKLDMGDGQLAELPTVEALDKWKQGLDAEIQRGYGSENAIPKEMARKMRRNLRAVLDMVDLEVPAYGAARKEFGDESDLIEAFEAGRDITGMKLGELSQTLDELPAMARGAYERGVLAALQDEIESKGPNALMGDRARGVDIVGAVFGNGKQRKMYEAALGPQKLRQLVEDYTTVADMGRTNREVGKGSQTARRAAQDLPALDESVAENFAGAPDIWGAIKGAVTSGARTGYAAGARGLTPDVATQYSILSGVGAGPGERASLIQLMRDVIEREAMAQQRNVRRTQQVGSVAGRLGGMTQ